MKPQNLSFRALLAAALLFLAGPLAARTFQTINDGWQFRRGDDRTAVSGWQQVRVPHSWNAGDCDDDEPGYYRGPGWYRRTLTVTPEMEGKTVYLQFEAVSSRADVYVNGAKACSHVGGYTAFSCDITPLVHAGQNLIEVRAENTHDPDIPPLSADFTFFGGILRDVNLIVTEPLHVSVTHFASPGVYLSTPVVNATQAEVKLRTMLTSKVPKACKATLAHRIFDASGRCVAAVSQRVTLTPGEENKAVESAARIEKPVLWDTQNPYLYRVSTTLADERGAVMDEVTEPLGVRSFSFDAEKGFFLNGRHVKLIGTNRHQDYPGRGYALEDVRHQRDVEQLRDMGGNFLRVSHYPQDPTVLATCDRMGILTAVEIPIVNAVTMSEAFADNCERMMEEMICQGYNNPSVCIWAYMNEVMLHPPFKDPAVDRAAYLKYAYEIGARCENTARRLDPLRATMLPCHGALELYAESGLLSLPQIIGVNMYQGWYRGEFADFERQLDQMYATYRKPIIVTEYGADADIRLRSSKPERFDYTIDYSMLYHEHYLPQILARDFMAGSTVWNLNDFYSEARGDAIPHVNCKGLNTLDRRPKDMYRYYQAMLVREPQVWICGRDRAFRSGVQTAPGLCTEQVKIYTNAPEAELFVNGESLGIGKVENCTAAFEVPFRNGKNRLEAVIRTQGGEVRDVTTTEYLLVPDRFDGKTPFTEMSVLLGTVRSFDDTENATAWIPERPYTPGGWGYVGGEALRPGSSHGERPVSNLSIASTLLDPLYQSQRRGIEAFRADVPDGQYEVFLYFAELTSPRKEEASVYQLGNSVVQEKTSERSFGVDVNGVCMNRSLDVAAEVGYCTPMIRRYRVTACDGKGIAVNFLPERGETMLNAIRIVRVY